MKTTNKAVLLALLFLYTVICGIIIADIGIACIAGSTRPNLLIHILQKND
ncbi:MAG: hypothetical protein GX800_04965 [Clostridiaceae bacterium]|nr:hypothetical protein [Clostridiaceae bacterium]